MATIDDMEYLSASGELYDSAEEDLMLCQEECKKLVSEYNALPPSRDNFEKRREILMRIFGINGSTSWFEPPFHANWGGRFVKLGKGVYANFNLTLIDDGVITIGDNVEFGPNVTIVTAAHPLHHEIRKNGVQYNKPVTIGDNCWLGAGVIVLPGVTIGDNSVIGAGSLVTKDIPANSLAYGSPARVIREIGEDDLVHYDHGRDIPKEFRDY